MKVKHLLELLNTANPEADLTIESMGHIVRQHELVDMEPGKVRLRFFFDIRNQYGTQDN